MKPLLALPLVKGRSSGQTFSVNIIIQEYSEPSDKQILLDAFNKGGSQGLYNAVTKMQSKGHIAITGTVGYDINYIREFPSATSRKIRLVTNRPITFGEVWSDSRSMSYNLSILELNHPHRRKATRAQALCSRPPSSSSIRKPTKSK